MANIYVRSSDGSNADNGSTWALAKASLAGAAAIDAAGDRIYISDAHAGSYGAAQSYAFAGTLASPVVVTGGDDAAEPPTSYVATWTETNTTNHGMTFTGAVAVLGGTFHCGTTGGSAQVLICGGTSANEYQRFVGTTLGSGGSGASSNLAHGNTGNNNPSHSLLENVFYNPTNATGTSKSILVNAGFFEWVGGGLKTGCSAIIQLFVSIGINGRGGFVECSGLDLSPAASTLQLFPSSGTGSATIRNSKLPASWTGNLCGSGVTVPGYRCEMHNCDSADTNYRMWVEDYAGSIKSETTVVRTGGASDGTTTLSWKIVSSANAEYPLIVLDSPEIAQWNDTTGSSITATVEIVTDNVTLNDDECWLEVQYLGTSGYPLASFISDCKADVLASAAAQTSSSETWTTTGLGTPVKQKLSVSFTPQEKGFLHAVVHLAKASTTVYVDPKITVT